MIRVNLLPVKELYAEVSRKRELSLAGVALGGAVLLFAGAYFYQNSQIGQLNTRLAALRQEIQSLNVKIKQVGDLEGRVKEFREKYRVVDDLEKQKIGPVRVMERLSAATPPSLWLTEFKETGGSLLINGLAIDNQTVAEFMTALAKVEYFNNVELVETAQGTQAAAGLKKFSIRTGVSYRVSAGENKKNGSGPSR